MKENQLTRFILCGLTGWCLECFWTGLHALLFFHDKTLRCGSSVWMFPIYGMASFLTPISKQLKGKSFVLRGGIYAFCIFFVEFVSGSLLSLFQACPWNYSNARFQIRGLVRLDFAPLWFVVGLLYEKLLSENHKIALYRQFIRCKKDNPSKK